MDLAIFATDANGTVTTWNGRAEAVYGWGRDEAVGRNIYDLTVASGAEAAADEVMSAVGRGQSWQGTFQLRRKDGSTFAAFVKKSPIVGDGGELVGVAGVSIEVTDPDLIQAVRATVAHNNHDGRRIRSRALSPREREVLGLLARGHTGEQIAEQLVLSPETVRTHIRNAREKLGASTRVEAVTMALVAREIQI